MINRCSVLSDWTSDAQLVRQIGVGVPEDEAVKEMRSAFSVAFSTDFEVLDLSYFVLDLAFIGSENAGISPNLRCFLLEGSEVSHDFSRIDRTSLSNVIAYYKEKDAAYKNPYEFGKVGYKFKCWGGRVISNSPGNLERITVQNYLGSQLIGEGEGADLKSYYDSRLVSVSSSSSIATVGLSKSFNAKGQDATYLINIKTVVKEVEVEYGVWEDRIRFISGSVIYLEFPRDLSPRLNKLGLIRCYQEDSPTYCNFIDERRISILVRDSLNHSITQGHNFSIIGIQ